MDVYKAKIQYGGSLDRLILIIMVGGDLQHKKIIGDTWFPTASTRTLKYFLSYYLKHKARGKIGFHWSIPTDQYKT